MRNGFMILVEVVAIGYVTSTTVSYICGLVRRDNKFSLHHNVQYSKYHNLNQLKPLELYLCFI
jgi:hypothetical protein